MTDLSQMRREYHGPVLEKEQMPNDPFQLFHQWFELAVQKNVIDANAMTLATVDHQHRPNARVVLLKNYSKEGFIFYSNYKSAKAQELNAFPYASIVFWWPELNRQIRVRGEIIKINRAASEQYFQTRSRDSNLVSSVSPQSSVIDNLDYLKEKIAILNKQYPDAIPCPEFWGGYCLKPDYFEFWQGHEHRFSDRIRYTKQDDHWQIDRLAP